MRNLGLVGFGRWGKNLARNFYELGVLHTICDLIPNQYFDVHWTTDFNDILNNPEITRVAIAAPAFQHYTLAKQALLAGKDVYVEKPLCMNISEAEELIELSENRILMVGHLLQYHPCVIKMLQMVKDGEIGKLQYIVSNRLAPGPIRTEENALWNFAPHDISVILALCNHRMPKEVSCFGNADIALTTMKFEDGIQAHVHVSWLNPFKEQKMTIIGSKGSIVFDDTLPWNEKLSPTVEIPQSEPLKNECSHFIHCCDNRIIPFTDGYEGLRVLKVLQAAQDSAAMVPLRSEVLSLR